MHPPVAQRRMQSAHPGDVVCHASHLRESVKSTNRQHSVGAQPHVGSAGPGHLGSHTSPVSLAIGVLLAVVLLVVPGAIVARAARLTWPTAVAVGPALTYGVVALAIVPFGAIGIPWNAWTALLCSGRRDGCRRRVCRWLLNRFRDTDARGTRGGIPRSRAAWSPRASLLGALLIGLAAVAGLAELAVDPEHMGRRLARQHDPLHPRHRPGVADAHGRAAQRRDPRRAVLPVDVSRPGRGVQSADRRGAHHRLHAQLAGRGGLAVPGERRDPDLAAAARTELDAVAHRRARPPPPPRCRHRSPRSPTSSSTPRRCPTSPPTASPCPTMVLVMSALRHRDRIPLAVLALLGVFSVHITGGVVTVLFVVAWWLVDALWHPVRGRLADFVALVARSPCRRSACCCRSSSACCSRPRSSSGTRSSPTRARSAA